jgi:hypothetical protein
LGIRKRDPEWRMKAYEWRLEIEEKAGNNGRREVFHEDKGVHNWGRSICKVW